MDPKPANPMPWQARFFLAALLVFLYAGVIAASFMWGDSTLQTSLCGSVVPIVSGAITWYFGSSQGSEKKDETIKETSRALANSTPMSNFIQPASLSGTLQMTSGTLHNGTAPSPLAP